MEGNTTTFALGKRAPAKTKVEDQKIYPLCAHLPRGRGITILKWTCHSKEQTRLARQSGTKSAGCPALTSGQNYNPARTRRRERQRDFEASPRFWHQRFDDIPIPLVRRNRHFCKKGSKHCSLPGRLACLVPIIIATTMISA